MKKHLPLLLSAIFIVCLLLLFHTEITAPMLATDSGFDVDFDTGGGSSGEGDLFGLIYLALEYPLLTLIFIIVLIVIVRFENEKKRKANGSNADVINQSFNDDETKELLLTSYQIYYDIQQAWMNFDYEKLRTLVTDELYNSYYNQLQTLELKGQKNIMRDFFVKSAKLLSHKQDEDKITVIVGLDVSFYDYIVDASGKVVRGKDTVKVTMSYHLTFVANLSSSDKCPNCGAPLDTPSYCNYCKSHIQGLSTGMRLAKKEAIKQKEE